MAAKKSSIDTKMIRELAVLLNETDLNEIELEEGEMRLRLSRGGATVAAPSLPAANTFGIHVLRIIVSGEGCTHDKENKQDTTHPLGFPAWGLACGC